MSDDPLLRCSDVVVTFRQKQARTVLQAVTSASLDVGRGQIVGLVGESGSGKSTLARAVVGLQPIDSGSITFEGRTFGARRNRADRRGIQMVFQDPYGSLDPRMTIRGTLEEMLRRHTELRGKALDARCCELMEMVRLPASLLTSRPAGMSGGQRQRVAIARALSIKPRLLVADEPVAALDVSVQAGIVNLLSDLRDEVGLSILFISHDLSIVRTLCDRVSVIYRGKIVEERSCAELFEDPHDDYTKELLAAIPRLRGPRTEGLRDGSSLAF
ncbi:ABC transporter ATP-binding protein [Flexivirga caeni]|uniref:ABC transporter ATP-binding protein n=1 Tax=Flexivirga caeni TaxID=2294115 RepID=A0A3M9M6G1_9MICO|nr:ATP-binding cassette domain-containing protein [Flexivirga caeni]RNI21076.1 ABC transporter ATP-binding protein [Flexivirga caeni]